jgi:protein-S-isoprenylcysteine O-methyltransferase Ste14
MSQDHRLVTWGPYKYVRHPSYLAYFFLFFGFFLTWLNIAAIPCFAAIPGYVLNIDTEEKMLIERFGDEYMSYQRRTGRFFPLIRKRKNQE